MRAMPAETDWFRFDLDKITLASSDITLRRILLRACEIGDDEGVHDDPDNADRYAEICERYRVEALYPHVLEASVAELRDLYDAAMSAWEYADQNNYGADDEPVIEDRIFGQHGKFMLHILTRPWACLQFSDDGYHGFTRIKED